MERLGGTFKFQSNTLSVELISQPQRTQEEASMCCFSNIASHSSRASPRHGIMKIDTLIRQEFNFIDVTLYISKQ